MEVKETVLPEEAVEVLKEAPEALTMVTVENREISRRIAGLKVTNEESYKVAVELGVRNRDALKRIELLRTAIVKPMNDHVKNINRIFKDQIAAIFTNNDEALRKMISSYLAKRKSTDSVQSVKTESGRADVREIWRYEITDESLIPREYLTPDLSKIGMDVRGGKREIPGVKIFPEKSTSFTAR
jgi:hypothetical protein